MATPLHIFGFAGSLRRASYNRGLLRAAVAATPEDVEIETFDIAPIPLYNDDVEKAGTPAVVQDFKARIAAADAILIVTPEYNYSMPGVLKNAIDWASRPSPPHPNPFNGKPLGMMGTGAAYGTVRAQLHLRQVAVFLNMFLLNKPEVMIQRAPEHFDAEGNLTDDTWRERVGQYVVALADWARRLRGDKPAGKKRATSST